MVVSADHRRVGRRSVIALALSYVGFVSLGLPDTVLGAAWPAIRADLGLPLQAAGWSVMVTTAGVVLSSASSGWVRARTGTAAVLVGSTVLAAIALALGAIAPSFAILLIAAFVAGLGGGAIDASLNDLVARRHSARHMNWLHACWGVGASVTPLLVSRMLTRGHSWRFPYAILAGAELMLALTFLATRQSWGDEVTPAVGAARVSDAGSKGIRGASAASGANGAMMASVTMFLLYGGIEAGMGLWATSLLTMTRGATPAAAGALVAVYWGALTGGRFVLGALSSWFGPTRILRAAVLGATAALAVLALPGTPPWLFGVALAGLGFALAPVYPLSMHDTPARFGDLGARLVGYQVAACSLGVAVIPALLGFVAAHTSPLVIPPALMVLAALIALEARRRRVPVTPATSPVATM